jgi:hypothetical protein
LLVNGFGLFSIIGFLWLHHKLPLADVTMGTKACTFPKAMKSHCIKLNKLSTMK